MNKRNGLFAAASLTVGIVLALGVVQPPSPTTEVTKSPVVSAVPATVVPITVRVQTESTTNVESPTNAPVNIAPPLTSISANTPVSLPDATTVPAVNPVTLAVPQDPVPNQIVIAFKPSASPQERQNYISQLGGTIIQNVDALNTVVISVPANVSAQSLPASTVIDSTEPDYFVVALGEDTNDPLYPQQWSLPVIAAPNAWATLPSNSPSIAVAVIDSGICIDHPDLQGRILPGYDFVDNDPIPQDDYGHGCSVAGIIAANSNNAIGMAGIAPNALILPLRVLNAQGVGTYSDVAAAIVYAVDNGAKIINLSLGGAIPSTVLENAVNYAVNKGITIIAAAGNTGGAVLYPAAYAPVVAVASVDQNLQRSSFSSYGPEVDLLAPGRDILTTTKDDGYALMSGTSFAAPQAAGVAALDIASGKTLVLDGGIVSALDNTVGVEPSETPAPGVVEQNYYYYANGHTIPLELSTDQIAIRFTTNDINTRTQAMSTVVSTLGLLSGTEDIPAPQLTLVPLQTGISSQAVVETIKSLRLSNEQDIEWVNPVFTLPDGKAVLTDEFVAQFPSAMSASDISAFNQAHDVTTIRPILGFTNTLLLTVTPSSGHDALEMANLYQESGEVVFAEPNFVQIIQGVQSSDPNRENQWYLDNYGQMPNSPANVDINAPEAWAITPGSSSIIIAILDTGVDPNHPDLINKLVAGYDAFAGSNIPNPQSWDGHGTAVAGIAAAESNNDIGITGVCQNCRIMPVRIGYHVSPTSSGWVTDETAEAEGINWAVDNHADILNNSWGEWGESTLVTQAFHNAISSGRNGKGAVVVAATGNNNAWNLMFPALLPDVIAVGSTDLCDTKKSLDYLDPCEGDPTYDDDPTNDRGWGSNYGVGIDIAAPGLKIFTTDILGNGGYNGSDYYDSFNGTSASTPIVSGVIGLMLSLAPELTVNQVQQVLAMTADDTNYATKPGYDYDLGWGRINAYKALSYLQANQSLPINPNCNPAAPITLITVASDGTQSNISWDDGYYSLSSDGRYIAFASQAANLVEGDTNNTDDVFVYDRLTCLTERVSVASNGSQGNNISQNPSMSADGNYIAFASYASNLVAFDTNNALDVFVRDRRTGITTRVSKTTGGGEIGGPCAWIGPCKNSGGGVISSNGRYVAFYSNAVELGTGTTVQIYLVDTQTQETFRISEAYPSGESNIDNGVPRFVSSDGRYVVFDGQATNLVASGTTMCGTTPCKQVYIRDRVTNQTIVASSASNGTLANNWSSEGTLSLDGSRIVFVSRASNLVNDDTNSCGGYTNGQCPDIFIRDLQSSETKRVSVASDGTQANNESILGWAANHTSISADGRYIVFTSIATNLVPGDTNGVEDVFLHDTQTGITKRISLTDTGLQATGLAGSRYAAISANGRYVVFQSCTSLVSYSNGKCQAYLVDLTQIPPERPVPSAPGNNTTVPTVQPTFSWSAVPDAESYEYQLDTVNPPVVAATSTNDTSFAPAAPLTGSIYYWRVRAKGSNNLYSTWSSAYRVTLDPPAPNTPVLSAPNDAEVVTTVQPTFTWEAANGASTYQIQLDTQNPPIAAFASASTTSYAPTTVLSATTYYWRVRAVGYTGKLSNWSVIRSVTIDPPPPEIPLLVSPDNGATVPSVQPTFTWNPAIGAASYEFQLDTVNPPQNSVQAVSETNFTPVVALTATTYYWRVRSIGFSGDMSDWSEIWSITIDPPAPEPPTLIAPDDGTSSPTNLPQFIWNSGTDIDHYEIQLSLSDLSTASIHTVFSTSYVPASPLLTTTYQWRVRAIGNSDKASDWSETRTLTVASTADAPPISNLVTTRTPTLSWSQVSWATHYEVQLSNTPDFGFATTDDYILGAGTFSVTSQHQLSDGIYYWQVRAQKTDGTWSAWSITQSFIVAAP